MLGLFVPLELRAWKNPDFRGKKILKAIVSAQRAFSASKERLSASKELLSASKELFSVSKELLSASKELLSAFKELSALFAAPWEFWQRHESFWQRHESFWQRQNIYKIPTENVTPRFFFMFGPIWFLRVSISVFRNPTPSLFSDKYSFCDKCFGDIPGEYVSLGDDPSQPQT